MPIFGPGQAKVARVPVDVDPAGLNCQLEVFLGPDENTKSATSGPILFTSTGVQQQVSAPITMPTAGGVSYRVFVDLYAEGYYLIGYEATEKVIIPSGYVSPPIWD